MNDEHPIARHEWSLRSDPHERAMRLAAHQIALGVCSAVELCALGWQDGHILEAYRRANLYNGERDTFPLPPMPLLAA